MMIALKSLIKMMLVAFFTPYHTVTACQRGYLLETGVTQTEKTQILLQHNLLRQYVAQGRISGQPAAENMQEMYWDNELAAKAQQWAEECVFKHDQSRKLGRFTMGQNLALIWSTIPLAEDDGDFPSRIKNWFDEVKKYAFGGNWSLKTGHYSQLVWGDTNLIGCGFSYYHEGAKYNKLYVCNYGPGGNVIGSKPYATGRPSCHSYGMNPSQKYPGLCKSDFDHNSIEFGSGLIGSGPSPTEVAYNGYKTFQAKNDVRMPIKNNRYQIPSSAFDTSINQQPAPSTLTHQPSRFSRPSSQDKLKNQPSTAQSDPYKTYRWDLLFNNNN